MNDGPIPTSCQPLDDLLGGGLERGTVTQVYGPPAAGKTNVALATAVETVARDGTAVYIDTEGLSPERLRQLLEGSGLEGEADQLVVREAHDFEEQEQAVKAVTELAPTADLVVLDSATGFYRLERGTDTAEGDALRQVANQVTHLLSLARRHDLAVLITNQVFTDPESDRVRGLGGNTLEHWTGTIVRLERFRGGRRRARLEKHRARPAGETAQFAITETGLTDATQR